jgi:mono/diheme cytochrome c family protein
MNFAMMLALAATVSAAPVGRKRAAHKAAPGLTIFRAKCETCHGRDAKGKAMMARLFGVKPELMDLTSADFQKKSDADAIKTVTGGLDKMPAFKDQLKPGQIKDVVSYVRSLAPKPEGKK